MDIKDILFLDYETRSEVDLKKSNAYNYAENPTTNVMCTGWAIGDGPVCIDDNGGVPEVIFNHIKEKKPVVAQNLPFEYLIYKNVYRERKYAKEYCFPEFELSMNTRCTMAACFAAAIPGSLEAAAPALGLDVEKDMAGNKAMMLFCKPNKDGTFWTKKDKPEKWQAMLDYCEKDIVVTREIYKRLPKLSDREQELWLLDQKINSRGVPIDLKSAAIAHELVELEKDKLNKQIQILTGGGVATCKSSAQLKEWLKWENVDTESVDKAAVEVILENPDTSELVKKVLNLKKIGAKSSNAKLVKMLEKANADGRVKGSMQFHVATTGRWAAWGLQLHNMPKRTCDQEEVDCFFEVLENV